MGRDVKETLTLGVLVLERNVWDVWILGFWYLADILHGSGHTAKLGANNGWW